MKRMLPALLCLLFILPAFGQVVTVSTNPAAITPSADRYMTGGTITFSFAEEFSSLGGTVIVVTLDRPDMLFSTSRPPRAYKNGYSHNAIQVVPTPTYIALMLDPKTYDSPFKTVTIENFTLDVLNTTTEPGAIINGQVWTNGYGLSFLNPTFRLFTVAPAPVRR